MRNRLLTIVWLLLAMPLTAQVGGFTGPDADRDGLPDEFEQAILEKFQPTWKIGSSDCNILPAEFVAGVIAPTVKERNGTIYGQVFIRGSSALGFFVEAHFYDLWAADCGFVNSHSLDAEHVSVLIRAMDSSQPMSGWHAAQWYAGAHEDTLCDSSQMASPALINAEDRGATIWVAWGKHGAFFSPQVCNIGGCSFDRCEATTVTLTATPINIGEPGAPLNGAVWISSDRWPLADKMRSDFSNLFTFSSLNYRFPDPGGASFSTAGNPTSTVVGYASVQSNDGSANPSGIAIFGLRRNNILITEAGVPATELIQSGRFYAEVSGAVNTGVAIVNPNSQSVLVSFFFTDSNGRNFGNKTIEIPAKGQVGRFLDDSPFNSGSFGRGTFTFSSSVPVSAVALRGFTNERSEFLITTLPTLALSSPAGQSVVFPQLADGGGWTTQIVLINPTDDVMSGSLQFWGQGSEDEPAEPLELTVNGQTGSSVTYTIAPRSSWLGRTAGAATNTRVGSAHVTPSSPDGVPSGVAIFSFRRGGVVVTESGVPAMAAGSAFRLFAESSGNFNSGNPGSLQTGLAIANVSDSPAALSLELTSLNGVPMVSSAVTVPARGQIALFLNQLPGFSTLPATFQGVLRISTRSTDAISVIGLRGRYNERRDFLIATTPSINESIPPLSGEMLFPYLAEGGGYTMQFILLSPADGFASGWLRYYSQSGVPLNLTLR